MFGSLIIRESRPCLAIEEGKSQRLQNDLGARRFGEKAGLNLKISS
jgi:hypothetical protein